jgi:hypothetical protein
MASKCANCEARLSCGCQRRTASNGASACSNCVSSLNTKLAQEQLLANQVVVTPPIADPNLWGANRYKTN